MYIARETFQVASLSPLRTKTEPNSVGRRFSEYRQPPASVIHISVEKCYMTVSETAESSPQEGTEGNPIK